MAFYGYDDERNKQAFHQRMESTSNPIEKLRYACLERGASGIKGLGRIFRIMDKDRSHTLSYDELRHGLHRYGLYLDDDTVQKLFRDNDKDGSGKIDFEEFLSAIKVTKEEFINYYAGVSESIDSDDYFEEMMIKTWGK